MFTYHHVALALNKHRDGIVADSAESTDKDGIVYNERGLQDRIENEQKTIHRKNRAMCRANEKCKKPENPVF